MNSKGRILIPIMALCCLCGVAVSVEPEISVDEEQTRKVSVAIGNDEIPLIFVKKDMPFALKNAIAADLEIVLSHLDKASFEQREKPRTIPCKNKELELTHRLVRRSKGRSIPSDVFPDVLKSGHFGQAVRTNGTYSLVIEEKVIDKYKIALTLKNKHPEMFAKLNDFIDMLEDQRRMKEISRDWEACVDIVYRHGEISKGATLEYLRDLASGRMRIRHPSLLEFRELNAADCDSDVSDDIFIMGSVINWTAEDRSEKDLKLPLGAYVKGKWRIFVYRMP